MSTKSTIQPEVNVPWQSNCAGEIFIETTDESESVRIGHFQGDEALAAYVVGLHHDALGLSLTAPGDDEAPWLASSDNSVPAASADVSALERKLQQLEKRNAALTRRLSGRDQLLINLAPWIERLNERGDYNIPGITEMRKNVGTKLGDSESQPPDFT
jgi:hypothetical protein